MPPREPHSTPLTSSPTRQRCRRNGSADRYAIAGSSKVGLAEHSGIEQAHRTVGVRRSEGVSPPIPVAAVGVDAGPEVVSQNHESSARRGRSVPHRLTALSVSRFSACATVAVSGYRARVGDSLPFAPRPISAYWPNSSRECPLPTPPLRRRSSDFPLQTPLFNRRLNDAVVARVLS